MDFLTLAIVFAASLVAAFIDVMVGGSSLIIIPALAVLGIPILTVIGTNRVYVVFFLLTGFLNYLRKKVPLNLKLVAGLTVVRTIGTFAGSLFVLSIPVETVKLLVGILMSLALVSVIFLRPKQTKTPPTSRHLLLVAFVMFLLGVYEGIVGGGAGIISRVFLIAVLGFAMLEAALADCIMAFAASTVSSVIFMLNGKVDYILLLPMIAGGVIGAFAGSHIAVKKGDEWVRKFLYIAAFALIAKMIFF